MNPKKLLACFIIFIFLFSVFLIFEDKEDKIRDLEIRVKCLEFELNKLDTLRLNSVQMIRMNERRIGN
jgi:hypothetical protein